MDTPIQNFSKSARLGEDSWLYITDTWRKVWLHVFRELNKHHLRFRALVRLHKQLSSTTISCLALVDRRYPVKELRILSNYPSMQAHHIIQLSVRFWMQHIQITCYRIQRRGGTERLRCGAPLQGPSPMSRWLHVNHNHLEWAWTLSYSCCCPEDTNLKPKVTLFEATGGHWWQGRRWWQRKALVSLVVGGIDISNSQIKPCGKKSRTQETCLT